MNGSGSLLVSQFGIISAMGLMGARVIGLMSGSREYRCGPALANDGATVRFSRRRNADFRRGNRAATWWNWRFAPSQLGETRFVVRP